jgi:hypothetical protein
MGFFCEVFARMFYGAVQSYPSAIPASRLDAIRILHSVRMGLFATCNTKITAFLSIIFFLLVSFSTLLYAGTSVPAGDLAPYGNPDGKVNIADVLILQQFISGIRVPTPTELLIADVAPLGAPDGVLNAVDMLVLMQAVTGKITLPSVTRSTPPQPINSSFIVVSDPLNGVVTVTGSASSVEGGTYVTVLNYATGATITVKARNDGSFVTTIAGAAGQIFSVVSKDIFSNATAPTSVAASNLLTLNVTNPANGATISDDAVLVTGTFSGQYRHDCQRASRLHHGQ